MSGTGPETADELHLLAGEYVLGVLSGDERRAVDRQAAEDPRLERAIGGWERRFAPMLTVVERMPPPEALWARIEQATAAGQAGAARPPRLALVPSTGGARPAPPRRVWPWQAATGASLALAAGIAAFAVVPAGQRPQEVAPGTAMASAPRPGGRDVALVAALAQPDTHGDTRPDNAPQMASDSGTARLVEPPPDTPEPTRAPEPNQAPARPPGRAGGYMVAAWPDGTVVLTPLAPVPVPAGKALELWIAPPDASVPKSLGLLAEGGRRAVLPTMPPPGTVLSVTLEPQGGSPTGAPTGRVVFIGTLRDARS
jgi:anti-sigma-K factor RskA